MPARRKVLSETLIELNASLISAARTEPPSMGARCIYSCLRTLSRRYDEIHLIEVPDMKSSLFIVQVFSIRPCSCVILRFPPRVCSDCARVCNPDLCVSSVGVSDEMTDGMYSTTR